MGPCRYSILLPCFLCVFYLYSCVDDKYDPDKLNPNNTFSPNGIALAIGRADTIFLGKILEDKRIDSLYADEMGYFLRYSGSFDVELPDMGDLQFRPQDPELVDVRLPEEPLAYLQSLIGTEKWTADTIPLLNHRILYSVGHPDLGGRWNARIDSVSFLCKLSVNLKISGIRELSGSRLQLRLNLPDSFRTMSGEEDRRSFLFSFDPEEVISAGGATQPVSIDHYDFTAIDPEDAIEYTCFL